MPTDQAGKGRGEHGGNVVAFDVGRTEALGPANELYNVSYIVYGRTSDMMQAHLRGRYAVAFSVS